MTFNGKVQCLVTHWTLFAFIHIFSENNEFPEMQKKKASQIIIFNWMTVATSRQAFPLMSLSFFCLLSALFRAA